MKIPSVTACFLASVLVILPATAFQKELPGAAASLADEIATEGRHQLAVVDFTDLQGNVTELGRFIAEEMALGLVTSKKQIAVIDRIHLRVLLQEHKLASSGIIDPTTARRLGDIAGVDALVTGTITPLGDSVRLVVKVLDTRTARILAASSVDIARTRTIEELLSKGVSAEASQVGPSGTASFATQQSKAESDSSGSITLTGTASKVDWVNPIAILHVVVKGEDGDTDDWVVTLPSLRELTRIGWGKNSVQPGEAVTVICPKPTFSAARFCTASMINFADGHKFNF